MLGNTTSGKLSFLYSYLRETPLVRLLSDVVLVAIPFFLLLRKVKTSDIANQPLEKRKFFYLTRTLPWLSGTPTITIAPHLHVGH